MVALSTPPTTTITVHKDGDAKITTVHPDILQTNILTRLDGPTLAATACVSSELHDLSTQEKLWQNLCNSTWPSINDPRVSHVISTFPSGHRSFFSDSYPLLHHHRHHNLDCQFPPTTELISAVDIYYQNIPILSKVVETETVTGWFLCSPFRVDLLEHKEFVHTWIQGASENDLWLKQLEEKITLSWILIDPKRKRAVNLSSQKPVSVQRHWLTGEVQVKFATIMAGDGGRGSEKEYVMCEAMVTCGGKEGSEVHVREVCMGMENMEGRSLSGKDSLVILQRAMESGERRKGKGGKEGKERLEGFLERKKERKEKMQRKERVLDMVCIATGVTIFVALWLLILVR